MMKVELPRTYQVGVSDKGRPTITILRKPSEMPYNLDQALMRLCGLCHLDGPNNRVVYEFLLPDKLPRAEEYLSLSMFQKVP